MNREATRSQVESLGGETARRFLAGVQNQEPLGGYTHNFYRYPARFSPVFARAGNRSI